MGDDARANGDAEQVEDEQLGRGGTMDDLRLAFRRNTGWIGTIGAVIGGLFHYFFIGCASLLGLLIVLLIPIVVAIVVAVLLGVPGYLVYHIEWLVAPGDYTSPWIVLVTIFWSGYFVTHGWPHLWPALVSVFGWFKPALVWMGRVLENISDDDEHEPQPTGDDRAAAESDDEPADETSEGSDEASKPAPRKKAKRSTRKKLASR